MPWCRGAVAVAATVRVVRKKVIITKIDFSGMGCRKLRRKPQARELDWFAEALWPAAIARFVRMKSIMVLAEVKSRERGCQNAKRPDPVTQ